MQSISGRRWGLVALWSYLDPSPPFETAVRKDGAKYDDGETEGYHRTAARETFTMSNTERHRNLAGLRGARLVTSVEIEQGRRRAEAQIKNLTGGNKISARFMRQDFFDFTRAAARRPS